MYPSLSINQLHRSDRLPELKGLASTWQIYFKVNLYLFILFSALFIDSNPIPENSKYSRHSRKQHPDNIATVITNVFLK